MLSRLAEARSGSVDVRALLRDVPPPAGPGSLEHLLRFDFADLLDRARRAGQVVCDEAGRVEPRHFRDWLVQQADFPLTVELSNASRGIGTVARTAAEPPITVPEAQARKLYRLVDSLAALLAVKATGVSLKHGKSYNASKIAAAMKRDRLVGPGFDEVQRVQWDGTPVVVSISNVGGPDRELRDDVVLLCLRPAGGSAAALTCAGMAAAA